MQLFLAITTAATIVGSAIYLVPTSFPQPSASLTTITIIISTTTTTTT
jgi:hypothetical protein